MHQWQLLYGCCKQPPMVRAAWPLVDRPEQPAGLQQTAKEPQGRLVDEVEQGGWSVQKGGRADQWREWTVTGWRRGQIRPK